MRRLIARALAALTFAFVFGALVLGALVFGAALSSCGEAAVPADEVVLTLHSASPLEVLAAIEPSRISPDARALGPRRFVLPRQSVPRALELEGYCRTEIAAPSGPVLDVALAPWVELVVPAPVGHDAPFEIEVRPGCREALEGSVTWEVVGTASAPLEVARRGFVVRGRTAAWEPPPAPSWGIVPVSASRAGTLVLRMRYVRPGHAPIEREARVLAEARTTGLPSVPIGVGVLLRGGPFRITERPPRAAAEPVAIDHALARLVPDVAGRWVLEDAAGHALALRSGEHAATPLDCGRGPCHARETEHARTSPMTAALASHTSDTCSYACHAVGEPGLPDGGFTHVALRLGLDASHEPMPRALRRLAGVGCTACHGPGAIPEASARWAILRTDVCASCHDAPPRYGHVAAWSSSRMATSDRDPATRALGCAECHTTAGFLAAIGARASTLVPDEAGPIGIACAACHAPHAEASLTRALVRRVPVPESLTLSSAWQGASSTVCLSCHLPRDGAAGSSSAAILLGAAGRDDEGSALVVTREEAPHAELPCVSCHASAPAVSGLERGAGHAFAIDRARCLSCHEAEALARAFTSAPILGEAASTRARALGLDPEAPHVVTSMGSAQSWNVALVLGDRGAWAHAPRYAARLLGVGAR